MIFENICIIYLYYISLPLVISVCYLTILSKKIIPLYLYVLNCLCTQVLFRDDPAIPDTQGDVFGLRTVQAQRPEQITAQLRHLQEQRCWNNNKVSYI